MTRAIPTPLHRDAALAHESHRHELLDPTTLRWVAELLKELEHLPCAQVAEHLQLVAMSAGRAIDVHWRRDVRGRPGSGAYRVEGASSAESSARSDREAAEGHASGQSGERAPEAQRVVSTKRAGGSGRTPAVATEATRRASR